MSRPLFHIYCISALHVRTSAADGGHSIEVQTQAGHSVAFNVFLHFATLDLSISQPYRLEDIARSFLCQVWGLYEYDHLISIYQTTVTQSWPRGAEDDHWWAAASTECRRTSDLLHRQVRPRSVSTASRWTALAWHPSASAVQACRDRPPVSPESSTDIPHQLLHSSVWRCRSPVAGTSDPPAAINWLFHVSAAAPSVVVPSLLLVPQSGIHCLTIMRNSAVGPDHWPVSTDSESENPPVSLLLAFRWQCVRGVFSTYSRYTDVHLLTFLLKVNFQ